MNENTPAGHSAEADQLHVVVGAGSIGGGIARMLSERGQPVRIVTRSGSGPAGIEAELVAADASDAGAMRRLTEGAAAIYNCVNPPYHRWPELWPPIAASLLGAAESCGGVLVTIGNLYGYGAAALSQGTAGYDQAHPMTEATPMAATGRKGKVRAQVWRDALAAHEAGRVRAVEIRASDYVGPGAQSVLGERIVPSVLRGKGVSVLGRSDRLHTWTYTADVARLAVIAAADARAWGRVWHTPSEPARTQRDAIDDLSRTAGLPRVPVRALPGAALRIAGLFSPLMRELTETSYQFSEDFVMDSEAARQTFGLSPTPWDKALADVLRSYGWRDATHGSNTVNR
ncbi:MAG: NAD-dependent epimerase/dehydratase family protein [Nocardiopsaceae bacterium]|jgi:nucleoside-diphosphate-sugar epimerase|nr:NAD-dependent epimerase/dehydratase family protein [Nocardiopsaceae bacterium]